jgi:hypothetical protein
MAADKEFSWPPMRINLSVYRDFAVAVDSQRADRDGPWIVRDGTTSRNARPTHESFLSRTVEEFERP